MRLLGKASDPNTSQALLRLTTLRLAKFGCAGMLGGGFRRDVHGCSRRHIEEENKRESENLGNPKRVRRTDTNGRYTREVFYSRVCNSNVSQNCSKENTFTASMGQNAM